MYESIIKHYPDFPKPGIDFIDILPFLQNKVGFTKLIADIDVLVTAPNVATVEARGFLFAAPLLLASGKVQSVIPIRKKGKLPFAEGDLREVEIQKEYGSDQVFYRLSDIAAGVPSGDVFNISFFDDILATGGTALGIANALLGEQIVLNGKTYKVRISEFIFLAELPALGGAKLLESIAPVHSFLKIDGE